MSIKQYRVSLEKPRVGENEKENAQLVFKPVTSSSKRYYKGWWDKVLSMPLPCFAMGPGSACKS